MFTSPIMKAVGEFVAKVGLPGALAIWLVWFFTSGQGGNGQKLDALVATQAATAMALEHHVQSTAPMVQMQQQILNVNLAQCVNAARAQRQPVETCFSALYQQPRRPETGVAGAQR